MTTGRSALPCSRISARMPAATRRTFSRVKSSPMTARQPPVPKRIIAGAPSAYSAYFPEAVSRPRVIHLPLVKSG